MGDLNANVGYENSGYERCMGHQGYGTITDSGERLVDLCSLNNLVAGGPVFPRKEIMQLTWTSYNQRNKNQTDHLIIRKKWLRSLQYLFVRRGADIDSDHHLVVA